MAFIGVTKGAEWYYVGGDYTRGTVLNNATEQEVLDYVIPADTVLNGIMIEALVRLLNTTAGTESSVFRIKVGIDGAEVEISQAEVFCATGTVNQYLWIKAVTDTYDWTQAQSVSITCDMSVADFGVVSVGYTLTIMGF